MDQTKLTRKQKFFIERYLECWNATTAATDAGYSSPGPSGARLLANPVVSAAINARMAELSLSANEVIRRLTEQATVNPSEFYVYDIDPATGQQVMTGVNWREFRRRGHLVKELNFDRRGNPILKFHDSQAALEKIGKWLGLFVDRVENTQNVNQTEVKIYIPDNGREPDQPELESSNGSD